METAVAEQPAATDVGGAPVRTITITLRIGDRDYGDMVVPEGLTVAQALGHAPEVPEGLDRVVVNDRFKRSVPTTSRVKVCDGDSLFVTAFTHYQILNEQCTKVLSEGGLPLVGLPYAEVKPVLEAATSTGLTSPVLVDGQPVTDERRRTGTVQQGEIIAGPDP